MASPSKILTLNVGSQTVTLAEFRSSGGGGLVLNKFKQSEIAGDLMPDLPKSAQYMTAVQDLLSEAGIKKGEVNYAVSSQSVFTRFVKLPSVEEDKVDQIIQFEAQQNVPFPIQEVVWDYQLVDSGADDKVEVVLVAIKSDLLAEVNDAVKFSSLKTKVVDVAPMALYNAFRYNYSDVSGCSLIVNIGAKTTDLIFNEPNKVFSRSIPIGGSTITSAIAKELDISPQEAENLKREEGFVSLGGAYADPEDPKVARASKIIRNTMTRLHAEINRSISFYRTQQNGAQPVRIYLSGGTASLPYMREFFAEKLQLPIEFLNPLRNVTVSSGLDTGHVTKNAHRLGEAVGLSLRSITDCPMELNLRPESVIQAETTDRKKPYLVAAALCLLALTAGWWFYLQQATAAKAEVLEDLNTRVSSLQNYERKFKAVRSDVEELDETAQPFIEAIEARQYWANLINDIHTRLPEQFVWITTLQPTIVSEENVSDAGPEALSKGVGSRTNSRATRGQKEESEKPSINGVRISGLYLDNPRRENIVQSFVESLGESPYLTGPEDTRKIKRSTPNDEAWAYDFEVPMTLNNPLPLN